MSVAVTERSGAQGWVVGRSRWFLVGLVLPFVAAGPVTTIPRHDVAAGTAALLVLVAGVVGALQLRHAFAAARGERPAAGYSTFLALAIMVYVPLWWYTWDWAVMQWFVIASGAMVLRGPAAVAVAAGPIVGHTLVVAWYGIHEPGAGPGLVAVVTAYQLSLLVMGGGALYGSAWLVRVLGALDAARTEMAELAVGRERLRVSRDLHDVLGQSLSAVSLKGDLALRLLPIDAAAARAEIASLTGLARDALRDVRAVARDERDVSLPAEIDAAVALLGAAHVDTRTDIDLPTLSRPVEEVLAWAVREGTTNMLRHSDVTTCSITAVHRDGAVRLEVVNDGHRPAASGGGAPGPGGTGLAGLAGRARAQSGTVSAGPDGDGRFRLVVTLPGEVG